MEASILYGKYDNLGNALIVRINNFSNPIYTVGGYLVGFTSNNINYYHFLKADFKKDDKDEINSGYYSVKDWLSYWADEKKLEDIKKFENETSFDYVQNGDTIVVEKQKIKSSTVYYNIVEVYKYTWNSNDHLIPFTDKIYIPSSIISTEKTYPADNNATNFFNNSKSLINVVSNSNKDKLAELLIYSAFCIHHINQSIFTLFTEPSHQANILEQKNFWSNPFSNASSLTEAEIMNLVENFYQEVVNFYAFGFRSKRKIEIVKQDKKFFYLALFMGVKALTTLTAKLKLDILISAKDEMNIFFEEEAVENLIIRVTQSFDNNTLNRIDEFLEGLIINKVEKDKTKKTLYQYIYEKMSSSLLITKGVISLSNWVMSTEFKPTDTKGQFVQTLYLLWQFSKYCPYNEDGSIKPNVIGFDKVLTGAATFDNNINGIFKYTHTTAYKVELDVENSTNEVTYYKYPRANNDAAPIVMPYSSEKYVNIFFENFKFEFQGEKILAKEAVTVFGVNATPNIGYNLTVNLTKGPSERAVLYGKYEIFQPITIINSDVDTAVPIYSTQGGTFDVTGEKLNSFVPLFVLLYVSETNQRNNSETLLGYAVDIPLTLSGIGNLPKIRHLRWAAAGADAIGLVTLQGLTIIIDGLTFTSQVLHYISLIMGDCAGQDGFCNDFKVFSDRLNIVCLCLNGGRMVGIGMTSLTRQASRLIDRVAAGSTSEAVIRTNLRARLVLANASATAETIDKTVDNIYGLYVRSNNLYTNPLGVALSLTFGTYKFAKVIFDKIVNTLIKQQNKLYNIADNIDVGEIVNFPPRFSIYKFEPIVNGEIITWRKLSQTVHTEAEICEIVRRGKELKFHDDLITHFLLRSLRVQKNKTYLQVIGFMDKYNEFKTVRNSVPYSFTSTGHLESFDNYFRTLLQKYGLEKFLDEYQISGSSLYQELVPDLDLCSYIKKGKFYEAYAESAELYYKNIHNPAIPDRMHNTLYKYFKKYIEAKPVFLGANPQITPRQIVENLENLDQLSAKGIIRMENGKIISLADELYQMKNLPNNIKPTLNKPNPNGGYTWGGVDFNIFINANNGRRLNPDLTIKIN